jgi:phage terminase large subunit
MASTAITIPAASWRPRPWQRAIWRDLEAGVRNVFVFGHRRFGKDELGLQDCAVQAAQRPGNYVYCLPETEHVRRSLWKSINPHTGTRRIDEVFPEGFRIGHPREHEMEVVVRSAYGKQSIVSFLGSDNYDAMVGASARGYYFSEWALADPMAVARIRPILAENQGVCRFLTTSRGKNHAWQLFTEMQGKKDWACHLLDARETGVFTAAQLAELLAESITQFGVELGTSLFEQEYYCTFDAVTPGSYYGDLLNRLEREGAIGRVPVVAEEPVYLATDLGYSDATACWYFQVTRTKEIRLVQYREYRKKTMGEILVEMKKEAFAVARVLIPHDGVQHTVSSVAGSVEEIVGRAGYAVSVMPKTDELTQVASVRGILPRCLFDAAACARGLECLRAYHNKYKASTDAWSTYAIHDWSSDGAKAMATLAYFADGLAQGARGTTTREVLETRRTSSGAYAWMG